MSMSWDERYGADEFAYGTEPNGFLASVADKIPNGKVLCLAEGEGRNAVYLAGLGYDVTAVDASAVGMEKAQRLAKERGVEIKTIVADLAEFDIEPDSWDGIVSIFCHVPLAIREPLHRKVVAGLKQGGVLVLEAYRPKQIDYGTGGPPVPELTMTLETLSRELDGLEFQHAQELDRDVTEGLYHTGIGAVVQLVAIKP
jgi:SAM-dependent methyltransferase